MNIEHLVSSCVTIGLPLSVVTLLLSMLWGYEYGVSISLLTIVGFFGVGWIHMGLRTLGGKE